MVAEEAAGKKEKKLEDIHEYRESGDAAHYDGDEASREHISFS